jgi:hypothetical protein
MSPTVYDVVPANAFATFALTATDVPGQTDIDPPGLTDSTGFWPLSIAHPISQKNKTSLARFINFSFVEYTRIYTYKLRLDYPGWLASLGAYITHVSYFPASITINAISLII